MALLYVIESPRDDEVFYKVGESLAIGEISRHFGWTITSRLVISETMLAQAFTEISGDSEVGIIHLAAHGNKLGIQLTDQTHIDWDKLVEIAGSALVGNIVVLAACESEGANGLCHAMRKALKPALLVVGTQRPVTYEESLIGWPLFYFTARRALIEGRPLKESFQRSVKLVNAVCGRFCTYHRWD